MRGRSPMEINPCFLNKPLFLEPSKVSHLIENTKKAVIGGKMVEGKPFEFIRGVAIIPISGVLVHDYYNYFGETLYSNLANSLFAAVSDPDVTGIALVFNSGGGDVSGCFELSDKIAEAREVKPIIAVLDDCAYSAAYCLACATSMITLPSTGGAGSIGVIALRSDITGAMEKAGVKITHLQFGDFKTDSYPTTELTKEGAKRLQADVNVLGEQFCELVAKNRDLDVDAVKAMEAGTFLGQAAVDAGLCDAVMTLDEALVGFMEEMETE
jgi:signal peptide peptidase SppA